MALTSGRGGVNAITPISQTVQPHPLLMVFNGTAGTLTVTASVATDFLLLGGNGQQVARETLAAGQTKTYTHAWLVGGFQFENGPG
jgi:hypothetical protein